MRKCIRCQSEMIEHCDIKVQGAGYGLTVAGSERIFADRLGKPQIAICPKCGEISIYIENVEKLNKCD